MVYFFHCSIFLHEVVCLIYCFTKFFLCLSVFFYTHISPTDDVFAGTFHNLEVEIAWLAHWQIYPDAGLLRYVFQEYVIL